MAKNRQCLLGAVLALVLALPCAVPAIANSWEIVYETDNLRVLKRDYAGSKLDEIKGVVRVKTSLNAVMALLKDAPFNHHWVNFTEIIDYFRNFMQ